jgi:hypothetical protein
VGNEDEPWRSYRPSPAAITALVAAVVGFVCSFSSTNRVVYNGVQTSCSFFDFAPLAFAVMGVVAGLSALINSRHPPRHPLTEISLGLVGIALAPIHVLRAFGILDSGC